MKTAGPALIALLNSETAFVMSDLLTLTLVSGQVYRYTSADKDIVWNGNTFSSTGLRFTRGSTRVVVGVEVDTMTLSLFPQSTDVVAGGAILQQMVNGGFDGARVMIERSFGPDWDSAVTGATIQFVGRVAEIEEAGRTSAQLTVKSDTELLNAKMPRRMYQPGCLHTLYDTGCGLNKSSFAVAGVVTSGSTVYVVNSGLSDADDYFSLGTIEFTSGVLSGLKRTVKSYSGGVFELILPLPSAPAIGVTFNAYPGCDKRQTTCTTKFVNISNFLGFPYVPVPETAH